jgi:hypothetical protein
MRRMAAIVLTALLAGCGGNADIQVTNLPSACVGAPNRMLKALEQAPGPVRVEGKPISHCFLKDQSGTDVQLLGTTLVAAAQQLGDRAGTDEAMALRLGYLVGAARRGARRNGVTDELLRRLEAETGGLGANQQAYQRGLRAGLATG